MNESFALWIKATQDAMLSVAKREQFTAANEARFRELETALRILREFEAASMYAALDSRPLTNAEKKVLS